jgi:hypothetical protein
VGGDFSEARIEAVRKFLQLAPGEYLPAEALAMVAGRVLGRMRG